jgi:membrane protease YdiL (CAAX protease family)
MIFRQWLMAGAHYFAFSFTDASLISTSLWILMHLPRDLQAALVYAGSGFILCGLRFHTGRVWPCVMAHAIYNAPAALMLAPR